MKRSAIGLLSLLAVTAACGSSNGGGDTTAFTGVIAAANESGTLNLTVATLVASVASGAATIQGDVMAPAASTVNVTGTLKIKGGASPSLSGTFDTGTKGLSVSGGGYSFTGTFSSGRLSGTYSGPNGQGAFSTFPGASGDVHVFCGSFTGDADGIWNLARHGDVLGGAFYLSTGGGSELMGALSGNTIGLTFSGGAATGTLSGSSMSGEWSTSNGNSGSWSGSESACP